MRLLRHGRTLFVIVVTALAVALVTTLGRLPPVVASHFDASGAPNGWSSRPVYSLVLIGIGVLLPLGMVVLVTHLARRGAGALNLPAWDYWSRPEHSVEAVARVRAYLWWLGAIMTGTALATHALVLAAHAHQPPRLSTAGILMLIATVMVAIGAWSVGWYGVLRRPDES
jgi:uncharacterized membrane protein